MAEEVNGGAIDEKEQRRRLKEEKKQLKAEEKASAKERKAKRKALADREADLEIEDVGDLMDAIIANLPLDNGKKQHILEAFPYSVRFDEECSILEEELDVAKIRSDPSATAFSMA